MRISQINGCQQALFFLGQLQENLHDIQNENEPWKDSGNRHIELPKILSGKIVISCDVDPLTFLLYDDEPNIVYLLATMEREYGKLISSIIARNELIERMSNGTSWSSEAQEMSKYYTDKIYYQFERCHVFGSQIMGKALKLFKSKFRKINFATGVTTVIHRQGSAIRLSECRGIRR